MTYVLSEEHQMLRQAVRELAEAKIGPAAADVDANARFPKEALDALTGAGFHAAHIPAGYGGEGADALAAVIIITRSATSGSVSSSAGRSRTSRECSSCSPTWP